MTRHDPDELKPCPHMQTLVSAWLDNALTGLLRAYTRWHVAHCPRCTAAIPVLLALRGRLRRFSNVTPAEEALTPQRRAAVESAWERADESAGPPPAA